MTGPKRVSRYDVMKPGEPLPEPMHVVTGSRAFRHEGNIILETKSVIINPEAEIIESNGKTLSYWVSEALKLVAYREPDMGTLGLVSSKRAHILSDEPVSISEEKAWQIITFYLWLLRRQRKFTTHYKYDQYNCPQKIRVPERFRYLYNKLVKADKDNKVNIS